MSMDFSNSRVMTIAGMLAMAVVAWYLYKHGELGSPTDMANEAIKDVKEAGKDAKEAAKKK